MARRVQTTSFVPGTKRRQAAYGGPLAFHDTRCETMAASLFICPSTQLTVQHWLDDDEDAPETEYEAITCEACARLHLINRKTGRLLGQMDEPLVS